VQNVAEKDGEMNPVWLQRACRNVENNIGSLVSADSCPNEINEEIFTLAFDAAVDAGAGQDQATGIAEQVVENMGVNR
jgi:hypothetical protein